MSKRKKVEMAARRVTCDEVPDQGDPIENHIPSSDGPAPVPTMDDNRWKALINEERPFNADMPRDTIPQALKELMSETLLIDDYYGKLHYFWAYMFFYYWNFSKEERRDMFEKIMPIGYRRPAWIEEPESLRGWFDQVYDKFTDWIWERVKLYGDMYLQSEEGIRWETKFNKASENSQKKPKPKIMNGILFGILELQEVFSPLLEICERTKSKFGCGYWISESNNGSWWADRLKQKFLQAVAIYVVGQTETPGSQTDRPMIEALRKCSPLPPPRQGIRPPAKNPGEMNWPSMDRPFDKLEAFNFVGLLGENEPCSTLENNEYSSTLSSEVLDEQALDELRSTRSHKTALSINSTLPEESGDSDAQSSGTITAPLQSDVLSKLLSILISQKNPEGRTRKVRTLKGKAKKSLANRSTETNVEERSTQTSKEVEEDTSLSPQPRMGWNMGSSGGTQPIRRVIDEGEMKEVADNLSENKSQSSDGSTRTSLDTYYEPEIKAQYNRRREKEAKEEKEVKKARDGEEVEKDQSRSNDKPPEGGGKAGESETWFPSSAGRKHEQQQKKSVDQRGGELPKEGRAREQAEATSNFYGVDWFPARSGTPLLPKKARAKEQVEATSSLAGGRGFPAPSGPSHLVKEGRAKEQVEATSSLAGGRGFPAPSGTSHLAKEGRAKEQVEAASILAGGRGFPAPSGTSHLTKEGRAKEQVEATSSLAGERCFPAPSGTSHLAKEGRAQEQVQATPTSLAGASNFPDRLGPSHAVPQRQQAIGRVEFAHGRRSVGRTKDNQRLFPFLNWDIDPATGIDITHKPEV